MNTTDVSLLMSSPKLYASWTTERKRFIANNPFSLWSGKPVKEVHHIIAVQVCKAMGRPDLIEDPINFVGMADRREHLVLGHLGISWKTVSLQVTTLDPRLRAQCKQMLCGLSEEQFQILEAYPQHKRN